MVTQNQLILAVNDLYDAVKRAITVEGLPERNDETTYPPALAAHYDDLAMALVTYVRLEPDAEDAIRTVRSILPLLDFGAQARQETLLRSMAEELRKFRAAAEVPAVRSYPPHCGEMRRPSKYDRLRRVLFSSS